MRVPAILLAFVLVAVSAACTVDTLPALAVDATVTAQDSHHHDGGCAPALSTASVSDRLFQPAVLWSAPVHATLSAPRVSHVPAPLAYGPTSLALQAPPLRI